METSLEVFAVYTALFSLLGGVLAFRVGAMRGSSKVLHGQGEPGDALNRRCRAHGNFVEYVPLALIMFGALALIGAPPWVIHALCGSLFIARAAHAYGISAKTEVMAARAAGAFGTILIKLIGAGAIAYYVFAGASV